MTLRVVFIVSGVAALIFVGVAIDLSPPDLAYDARAIPITVAGGALVILGALWHTNWRRFTALLGLTAIGQACALQLIHAPRYADFQHYLTWRDLVHPDAPLFAVVFVALQLCVCAFLAWRNRVAFKRAFTTYFAWWQVFILALVFGFSAAVPTESIERFAGELALSLLLSATALLTLVFAVLAAPEGGLERLHSWFDARVSLRPGAIVNRPWDRRLPWFVAGFVVVVAGLLSVFVFETTPHIEDTVAYLFQAKTLASGHLYLPSPPDAAAFDMGHIVNDGSKWFGKYFPGWPFLLSLGTLAGIPWLVNAAIGGVTVLLAHGLIRRLSDGGTANVVICLLATSPWFLFMSATYWAHPTAALWTLVALYGVARQQSQRGIGWAALSGFAIGALFLTRPLDGVLIGAVVGIWALGVGGRRLTIGGLLALGGVAATVAAVMLPYNLILTGRATYAPFTLWSDMHWGPGVDVLGFGPEVGILAWPNLDPLPGHGITDVVLNTNKNLFMANVEMLGWMCGSLIFVVVGLLWWRWRRADFIFLAVPGMIILGQQVYWFSGGPDLGPRYWYPMIVPLLFLTARGMRAVASRESGVLNDAAYRRVLLFAGGATLCALLTFAPWRGMTKYYRYRDMGPDVMRLAEEHGMGEGLVFVRSELLTDYQAAFAFNPRTLSDDGAIYARDVDRESRSRVVAAFPERTVWVIGRPSGAHRIQLLQGPLPPGTTPN